MLLRFTYGFLGVKTVRALRNELPEGKSRGVAERDRIEQTLFEVVRVLGGTREVVISG